MTKCCICNHRPARTDDGYCATCDNKVAAERRRRATQGDGNPVKYLTYRGAVVGLFREGDNGKLKARLLRGRPELLPKTKTINLDKYCPGFDREQIKSFKRCVLQLSNA